MRDDVTELLDRYPLISDQVDKIELRVILTQLRRAYLRQPGSVVEFGCYVGTTSLFIRRLLDRFDATEGFHVYDSFQGLPEKGVRDQSPAGEQFRAGELSASKKSFDLQFRKAGLKRPTVHKSWFNELRENDIPSGVTFAYLDGDYYESISVSLQLVEPKLVPEATIVVDDYANEALPGAKCAVDEWLKKRTASLRVEASLAIIQLSS